MKTEAAAAVWLGRFLGGIAGRHAALLDFCATQLCWARERLALAHDNFGAPILLLDGAPADWRISSSSRENIALFALSREKVGVDVEIATNAPPAWNVLHEKEKAALAALPLGRQGEAFLRIWTAKEAYLKALGLGLRREPADIGVDPLGRAFRSRTPGEEPRCRRRGSGVTRTAGGRSSAPWLTLPVC